MHKIKTLLITLSLILFAAGFVQDYYELPQPVFDQTGFLRVAGIDEFNVEKALDMTNRYASLLAGAGADEDVCRPQNAGNDYVTRMNNLIAGLDSLNKADPLPVHDYPLCFAELYERSHLLDGASPELIDSLLTDQRYYSRARAAAILSKGVIVDTNTAIVTLVSALNNEIKEPSIFDNILETPFTTSECIKLQYSFALINLIGETGKELLQPFLESATGELKKRIILTLGYTGDSECRQQVRDIYPNLSDGYLRFLAMEVVVRKPDTLDIPIIGLALNDSFSLVKNDEVSYPVRSEAFAATRILGLNVEKQNDKFIISEIDK